MKNVFFNLTQGNSVTQRNAFVVILVIMIVAVMVLNHCHVIDLSAINAR